MEKRINLKENVYQLTQRYPELIELMASLGFTEIRKKAVRMSVGKVMTLTRGAAMKGIPMERITAMLEANGFIIEDDNGQTAKPATTDRIKQYLQRLNNGEQMDAVRADFAKEFNDVDATEIMKAEQQLIGEGQPIKQVKELCDVHSALFHDAADDFHHGLHHDQEHMMVNQAADSKDKTAALRNIQGHPLQTFYRENEAIRKVIDSLEECLHNNGNATDELQKARIIATHYAKKGDLIYPLLNVKYGIYGPSKVMWTIDDEIRAEISSLLKASLKVDGHDEDWNQRVEAVAKRAREMTFKEDKILFPVSAANFSDSDWMQIYADSKSYSPCQGVVMEAWKEGETYLEDLKKPERKAFDADDRTIIMPGGRLTISQLTALLDTLPMEITFVDADNINRYFNQPFTEKVFKRPLSALGREVFTCHPPKVEPMVRSIIQDFRDGKRDKVAVWMQKNGRATLVTYMAVRDSDGQYIGTMEAVQDMEDAKTHFSQSR